MGITRYEHHGVEMAVREDMKGRHREHCLCFSCAKFHPEDRERNCRVANLLYAVCQAMGIVTPVWECGAGYEEKEETVGVRVSER